MCNRHVYGYVANIRSCQCSQSGYVLGMSRDLPPDMPRRPEIWVSLCNLMLTLCGIYICANINQISIHICYANNKASSCTSSLKLDCSIWSSIVFDEQCDDRTYIGQKKKHCIYKII